MIEIGAVRSSATLLLLLSNGMPYSVSAHAKYRIRQLAYIYYDKMLLRATATRSRVSQRNIDCTFLLQSFCRQCVGVGTMADERSPRDSMFVSVLLIEHSRVVTKWR